MASTKKSRNGFSSQLRIYEAPLALKAVEEGNKEGNKLRWTYEYKRLVDYV